MVKQIIRLRNIPCFKSQPSRSGLKNVLVKSFPSSSGILNGSFLILSYNIYDRKTTLIMLNFFIMKKCNIHYNIPKTNLLLQNSVQALTVKSWFGKSLPSLIPLFIAINLSTDGLSLTLGLCKLVFSMIIANDKT